MAPATMLEPESVAETLLPAHTAFRGTVLHQTEGRASLWPSFASPREYCGHGGLLYVRPPMGVWRDRTPCHAACCTLALSESEASIPSHPKHSVGTQVSGAAEEARTGGAERRGFGARQGLRHARPASLQDRRGHLVSEPPAGLRDSLAVHAIDDCLHRVAPDGLIWSWSSETMPRGRDECLQWRHWRISLGSGNQCGADDCACSVWHDTWAYDCLWPRGRAFLVREGGAVAWWRLGW